MPYLVFHAAHCPVSAGGHWTRSHAGVLCPGLPRAAAGRPGPVEGRPLPVTWGFTRYGYHIVLRTGNRIASFIKLLHDVVCSLLYWACLRISAVCAVHCVICTIGREIFACIFFRGRNICMFNFRHMAKKIVCALNA